MADCWFSILYNRGVYPEESFVKVKKYGLPMLLTQDEGVRSFISNLNAQLSGNWWFDSKWISCTSFVLFSQNWCLCMCCWSLKWLVLNSVKNGWKLENYRGLFWWSWVRPPMRSWRGGISVSRLIVRLLSKGNNFV